MDVKLHTEKDEEELDLFVSSLYSQLLTAAR